MRPAPTRPARTVVATLARPIRAAAALLAVLLLAAAWLLVAPSTAHAAGDEIDDFDIAYTVDEEGVLHVEETIVYRFGSSSGRHGIERKLVTREKWDEENDASYTLRNIRVTSPSGHPADFTKRTSSSGRQQNTTIRVGDPDKTISDPTATYVLSYELLGTIRPQSGYDEFYWDATGFDWDATIKQVDITADVPGGAQDISCFSGPVGSKDTCASASGTGGTATFSQSNLEPGDGVSIGVMIEQGLVADNQPHLSPDATVGEKRSRYALLGATGVSALLAPLLGWLWWRRAGRDLRYQGLAPGTVPFAGTKASVARDDGDITIPVAFSPPKIPVAEAGMLIDGQVDTRETAATLVDLAVRGALTLSGDGGKDVSATLVDPNLAAAPHEMVLMTNLFGGRPPGATVHLGSRGSMVSAHRAMVQSVRNQVTARGWFTKTPSAARTTSFGFTGIAFAAMVFVMQIGGMAASAGFLWLLLPLLPIGVTVLVLRAKRKRGQRTPDGRAVCDQVEGFKLYLETAEAEQLRFEEGEDIFSRYLPWAITFDLADRWARICAQLVATGRMAEPQPGWYHGTFHLSTFNAMMFTNTLSTAATPVPSSSSGTGFGGGSSFGGGGFSGGGGGGGGGGSW